MKPMVGVPRSFSIYCGPAHRPLGHQGNRIKQTPCTPGVARVHFTHEGIKLFAPVLVQGPPNAPDDAELEPHLNKQTKRLACTCDRTSVLCVCVKV